MFTYIEIINSQSKSTFSFVNFEIINNTLTIKPLKGMRMASALKIPISQITNIHEDIYYGSQRIQFEYNHQKYIFIYSGYGEFDYLKENLKTAVAI